LADAGKQSSRRHIPLTFTKYSTQKGARGPVWRSEICSPTHLYFLPLMIGFDPQEKVRKHVSTLLVAACPASS
jgi:hypothetical protein